MTPLKDLTALFFPKMTKYLLDTHVILWYLEEDKKLPLKTAKIIAHQDTFISAVNIWELVIKSQLGKLETKIPISQIKDVMKNKSDSEILPISLSHILNLSSLELIHGDPFDRLLISQAQKEKLTLLTRDKYIKKYPVETYWK